MSASHPDIGLSVVTCFMTINRLAKSVPQLTKRFLEALRDAAQLTIRVIAQQIFEDLDMTRNLLSCPSFSSNFENVVCNQFVAPTRLSFHRQLSSSNFWNLLDSFIPHVL